MHRLAEQLDAVVPGVLGVLDGQRLAGETDKPSRELGDVRSRGEVSGIKRWPFLALAIEVDRLYARHAVE